MLADTMKQVQDAEKQAKDIIRNAEEKAAAIVEEAKTAAAQRRQDAESRASEEAKASLQDVSKAGDEEKAKYAASVNEQLESERQQAYSKKDEAVDAIIAGLV
ncbi:MAG: hypothetical protein LIO56_00485 [Lachnospiraceae bacterium]|nr:hypothetical protein [Lachnospiraceae bacterium]